MLLPADLPGRFDVANLVVGCHVLGCLVLAILEQPVVRLVDGVRELVRALHS